MQQVDKRPLLEATQVDLATDACTEPGLGKAPAQPGRGPQRAQAIHFGFTAEVRAQATFGLRPVASDSQREFTFWAQATLLGLRSFAFWAQAAHLEFQYTNVDDSTCVYK